MPILNLYKLVGATPLEVLEAYKRAHPDQVDVPMVYAGRLDPMASGVLLVLSGEERHQLPMHLSHGKKYQATFAFGLTSDTFDVLGLVSSGRRPDVAMAQDAVESLTGSYTLPLPAYSAFKVQGKPLHWWAREGKLDRIVLPQKQMAVEAVKDVALQYLDPDDVLQDVRERVAKVQGDFRQQEVLASWEAWHTRQQDPLLLVSCELDVSSGTYIRSLAHMMGQALGCGALLFSLHRTRVGDYDVEQSLTA